VRTALTNDINTYYAIYGKGKPLFFIHGAGASHKMWKPQVEHFSTNCEVLPYDVRGYSLSEGSDKWYSCELFAGDLRALLRYLDAEKPVVCGLSLGGMIAQEYAVKYPSDLQALGLADTASFSALTGSDALQKTLFPKFAIKLLVRLLSRERYAAFGFSFCKDIKPDVKEYLIEEHLKFSREELLKVTDAIYDSGLLDLSRTRVPTLIIVGERERKAVFVHAEKMHALIDDSSMETIDDAMHASNLENPKRLNSALEDFFFRLAA
jgi:pimeloyl-ACP methyl ester carboxylesterase